jgi:hypothetical protein
MKVFITGCISILIHGKVLGNPDRFATSDVRKADSIAAIYQGYSLFDLRALALKLTLPLATEEEKFRAVYKWVCDNIGYDYPMHLRNQDKRRKLKSASELDQWNKKIAKEAIVKLLQKRITVCSGYAHLLKELCSLAGITCIVIDGYGRTAQANVRGEGIPNHSWNAVKLNDVWYLCDATWASGAYDTQAMSFVKKYTDAYFLPDPTLFIRNHFPLDTSWMLMKQKPSLQEFLNAPLIYADAYTYGIQQLYPKGFDVSATKREAVSFRFHAVNNLPIQKIELVSNGNSYPKPIVSSSGEFSINHIFKAKGSYPVHVRINEQFVITYSVSVK